jgi:hypothetical protein
MREIVTVFGLPDKPMEVNIPKDLVRTIPPLVVFALIDVS